MRRLTGAIGAVVAVVSATALLFASIHLGLRVPGVTHIEPFGGSIALDYRALGFGSIAPLRSEFIAQELGSVISELASAPDVAESSGQSGRTIESSITEPVVLAHTFTNDSMEDALHVSSVPFTAKTNTSGAGRGSGEPADCAPVGGTAWYQYRASRSQGLIANTFGSRYPTALGVFAGDGPGEISPVGCDTDARGFSQVAFAAERGTTYWFQIAGPVGGGNLVFNLTLQGVTSRASLTSNGAQAASDSLLPSISADGRFVSFYSGEQSFTPDTPPPPPCVPTTLFDFCRPGVFLRDRKEHRIARVDVGSPGELPSPQRPTEDTSITGGTSADGRYVAFYSTHADLVEGDTNETWDVFVLDRRTGRIALVSRSSAGEQGNQASFAPALSADGRYVAFTSVADNLVPDDNNLVSDVFVRDLKTGVTTRASVSSSGEEANQARSMAFPLEGGSHLVSMSANGRFVLFRSVADNLVPADTNEAADMFLHDLRTRTTTRVSVSSTGAQADADSRQPLGIPQWAVSDNGRYVFFNSEATNLVPRDRNGAEDLFVRDTVRGTTRRVSVSSDGTEANLGVGDQDPIQIWRNVGLNLFVDPVNGTQTSFSATPDGRYVVFSSGATNLVPGDTNEAIDIFLHHLPSATTMIVSVSSTGKQGNGPSTAPALSADARFVVFQSAASNLVPDDTNDAEDIFVNEIPRGPDLSGWF